MNPEFQPQITQMNTDDPAAEKHLRSSVPSAAKKEHSPKISVIVPVYKVEKYLPECIESVLAQTFTDFELILVDDGSPDNCGAICDAYAARDPRIRVFHKENGGVSSARNLGLDHARGEWIAFVDSDDRIERDWLPENFPQGVDLVVAGGVITHGRRTTSTFEFVKSPSVRRIGTDFPLVAASWMYFFRRTRLNENSVRFPLFRVREDLCFNILALHGVKLVWERRGSHYRYRSEEVRNRGSLSSVSPEEFLATMRRLYSALSSLESSLGVSFCEIRERIARSNIAILSRVQCGVREKFRLLRAHDSLAQNASLFRSSVELAKNLFANAFGNSGVLRATLVFSEKAFWKGISFVFAPVKWIKSRTQKKRFSVQTEKSVFWLTSEGWSEMSPSPVLFGDETCPDIRDLFWAYRMRNFGVRIKRSRNLKKTPLMGTDFCEKERRITWNVPPRKNSWNCLYFPVVSSMRAWRCSFVAFNESVFSEFQIAFAYKDITNRCRFNIVENRSLNFDVIRDGFFFNVASIPFSFPFGEKVFVVIECSEKGVSFAADGVRVMHVDLPLNEDFLGELVLLTWDHLSRPIKAFAENFRLERKI